MSSRSKLWLCGTAHEYMLKVADRSSPNETGGVLMGYISKTGEPVITNVVGPGPKAEHSRMAFVPDYGFHEREVARIYAASRRCITYMGDWHTHPMGSEKLSNKDRDTIRTIARSSGARMSTPVMLILSDDTDWTLVAWQGKEKKSFFLRSKVAIDPIEVQIY